jgi:hypothetical protein
MSGASFGNLTILSFRLKRSFSRPVIYAAKIAKEEMLHYDAIHIAMQ